MKLDAFYRSVEEHPELKGVSIEVDDKNEGSFAVEHLRSKLVTVIPSAAVEAAEWDVLEEVLTCKREPQVLYHMTRVVGYYSRVQNWNNSKIGELKDRHAGDYALAEA